jgi:TolA-binding protein
MKGVGAHGPGLSAPTVELVELARESLGEMSERQRVTGLRSLEILLANRRGTRALARWSAASAAGAALCGVGLGAILYSERSHPPISLQVEGAELRVGGYVEALPSVRPVLRFSDGSEVGLAERSRVRVRSADEHGARVTLNEGTAHVYVVHLPGARWSFDAGPFVLDVTGTAFVLAWSSVERRLDVKLENGSVTVSGPMSDAPIGLRAGQWLTVRGNEILIRGLSPSELAPDATPMASVQRDEHLDGMSAASQQRGQPPMAQSLEQPATPNASALTADARPDRASKPEPLHGAADAAGHVRGLTAAAPRHHWGADLASGKVTTIVDDALRFGLDKTLNESSCDELSSLGDAARYTRRNDIALAALYALRRRFPESLHARDAAFLLGRVAETQQDPRGALSWFDAYLSEAPDGTYASEALGRKMTVLQRLEGTDAARPLAEIYLRRFPHGTYAQAAEALSSAR